MKNFSELLREAYRRELSALLMKTDQEHHLECSIWIESGESEANVEYLYQMPTSGEIGVGINYAGYEEEKDLDDVALEHQREIIEYLFTQDGMEYIPMALVEREGESETPILVVGKHLLRGGAYPQIEDAMREHLGNDLVYYEAEAARQGLLCGGDYYIVTHNLSTGEAQTFLGREYRWVEADSVGFGIDDLIRLTPEQQALAGEMRALYERMQQANIAFAMNDNGSVVCYNCEHIDDCEPAHVFASIPDGYEVADMEQMQSLFPVWQGETMCLLREEEE